jgi:hypothetical protein
MRFATSAALHYRVVSFGAALPTTDFGSVLITIAFRPATTSNPKLN